jgi:hypothetical protein
MVFYENKDNLSKLWDILAVYAWIDREVGYCQGILHKFLCSYKDNISKLWDILALGLWDSSLCLFSAVSYISFCVFCFLFLILIRNE